MLVNFYKFKESDEMHQWIGKWLHLIYMHLQHAYDCSQKTLDSICSLHIFPMTNGSMMSLKDNVAFFPVKVNYMDKSAKIKEKGWFQNHFQLVKYQA